MVHILKFPTTILGSPLQGWSALWQSQVFIRAYSHPVFFTEAKQLPQYDKHYFFKSLLIMRKKNSLVRKPTILKADPDKQKTSDINY